MSHSGWGPVRWDRCVKYRQIKVVKKFQLFRILIVYIDIDMWNGYLTNGVTTCEICATSADYLKLNISHAYSEKRLKPKHTVLNLKMD